MHGWEFEEQERDWELAKLEAALEAEYWHNKMLRWEFEEQELGKQKAKLEADLRAKDCHTSTAPQLETDLGDEEDCHPAP